MLNRPNSRSQCLVEGLVSISAGDGLCLGVRSLRCHCLVMWEQCCAMSTLRKDRLGKGGGNDSGIGHGLK